MRVFVQWTKMESASKQRGEDKVYGSLTDKQICMSEPLNNLTMVFYLDPKKKKTIYTGKLPTSKRRTGNLFGFSF